MDRNMKVSSPFAAVRMVDMGTVFIQGGYPLPQLKLSGGTPKSGSTCMERANEDTLALSDEARRKSRAAATTGDSPELSARKCLDAMDSNFDGALSAKELGIPNTALAMLDQNADGEVDEAELRSRDERAPYR